MIKPADEIFTPFHINKIYDYQGPFDQSIPVAEHYGFRLVKPVAKDTAPTEPDVVAKTFETISNRLYKSDLEHKFDSLNHYLSNQDSYSTPAMLCHTMSTADEQGYLNLEIYGTDDPFVETVLLKSSYEILVKAGYKNLMVELNSFGSKESYDRFMAEVKKFTQKHLTKFDQATKSLIQESPLNIYKLSADDDDLDEVVKDILLHRPRPVAQLSESCRIHLKELLEHLEDTGMPYHLNANLFPRTGKHTETVYTVINLDNDEVLAYGERFTTQAAKHRSDKAEPGSKKAETIDCAAISIALPAGKAEQYDDFDIKANVPSVYFAHSGAVAKKQTLSILAQLFSSSIPVKHSVIKNSLREQLYHAEKNNSFNQRFPITLILGVKEVQDGTILVRNNLVNRQKAVPINRMCSYVKRSLKAVS